MEPDADDPPGVGIDRFELPSGRMRHALALGRDVAGQQEHQPEADVGDQVQHLVLRIGEAKPGELYASMYRQLDTLMKWSAAIVFAYSA